MKMIRCVKNISQLSNDTEAVLSLGGVGVQLEF